MTILWSGMYSTGHSGLPIVIVLGAFRLLRRRPAAQAELRVPRPIRLDRVIASDWDYDALGIPENNCGECVIVLAVVMINREIHGY